MAIELKSLSKVNGFEVTRSSCQLRMLTASVTRVEIKASSEKWIAIFREEKT